MIDIKELTAEDFDFPCTVIHPGQGELSRAEIDSAETVVEVLTGPTQKQLQVARDYWLFLPEIDITARVTAASATKVGKSPVDYGRDLIVGAINNARKVLSADCKCYVTMRGPQARLFYENDELGMHIVAYVGMGVARPEVE